MLSTSPGSGFDLLRIAETPLPRPGSRHSLGMNAIAAWTRKARQGDLAAFRSLYEEVRPGLHNVVRRLCGDDDLSQEIVQRSFVRAWENLTELREDLAFSGWMRRIAVNLLRDHWRRDNRNSDLPDDDDLGAIHDPSPGPEVLFEDHQIREHLEEALADLPEMFRIPVVLHYIDDRSVEEVANLLDIPRGTVLSRLSRARGRLRDILTRRRKDLP